MSKLEELIQEYCPDGVEYKSVGEVCDTITDYTAAGSFADIAKNVQYINNGKGFAQLIRTTDLKNDFTNQDRFVYVDHHAFDYLWRVNLSTECLVMPNVGNCGEVYYVTPDFLPEENNVLGPNAILVRSSTTNIRFLYHLFLGNGFQTKLAKIVSPTGQTKFNKTNFKQLTIPVPPLPVQEEIVRILDSFTQLTAELQAELQARKKQYEYYKNKVFTSYEYEDVSLGEILYSIHTGLNPRQFFKLNTEDARNYYVTIREFKGGQLQFTEKTDRINDEAMRLCNNRSNLEVGDVLFSGTGTVGETYVIEDEPFNWNIKEGVYALKPNPNKVVSKYLKYYLSTKEMQDKYEMLAEGGTVKSISMKKMDAMRILLPSLESQKKIVEILDRFDILCNDIYAGLPAEIEARQKQYEYYRDKLLTFKEIDT